MTHRNEPLTPAGRKRLARLIVVERWFARRVAERLQYESRAFLTEG